MDESAPHYFSRAPLQISCYAGSFDEKWRLPLFSVVFSAGIGECEHIHIMSALIQVPNRNPYHQRLSSSL